MRVGGDLQGRLNTTASEGNMRLDEIEPSNAAEQRVKRMNANASAAKDRAKLLKVQADTSAERLERPPDTSRAHQRGAC